MNKQTKNNPCVKPYAAMVAGHIGNLILKIDFLKIFLMIIKNVIYLGPCWI